MLSVGQLVNGRYSVIKEIGRGAMGAVYLVQDTLVNDQWALKEFSPVNPDVKDQERFHREAQMLANLDHPNLPKVVDFFVDQNNCYLVMEYIEGENLGVLLKKNPSGLSEKQVWPWLQAVLEILNFLHRQNPAIIFRDIKPDNLILHPSGKLYLVDAGIAVRKIPGQAVICTAGQMAQTAALATTVQNVYPPRVLTKRFSFE